MIRYQGKTAKQDVILHTACRKTSIVDKNGVWGVAPRQVAGTPVPVFSPGMDAGRVCTRALQGRKANQAYTAFHGERGFGKDAEIRTHQALHDAKPSECPNGDRD